MTNQQIINQQYVTENSAKKQSPKS